MQRKEAAIVSHLTGIERHLEIYLERFSLWQPTPKELEGFLGKNPAIAPEPGYSALV